LRHIRREELHLSQAGLGRRMEVDQAVISRLETGVRTITERHIQRATSCMPEGAIERLKEACSDCADTGEAP